MDRIEDQIRESRSNLDCIERRIAGGTCGSLLERVSKAGKAGVSHFKEMFGKLNDMVTDITMLLVAVAIKNILFPILFLLGAVKCSLPVARHASRLLSGFERDSRKLKSMTLYTVGESNEHGGEPMRDDRLREVRLLQRLLARQPRSLLLFDEMEDLLSGPVPGFAHFGPSFASRFGEGASKVFMHRLLEQTPTPTLWTMNDAWQVSRPFCAA